MDRLRALGRKKLIAIAAAAVVVIAIACCGLTSLFGNGAKDATPTPEEEAERFATIAVPDSPVPTSVPPTQTEAVRVITTERGEMSVPGVGYLDGRDAEADPPLTVMTINLWDTAQRTRAVCQLEHGTQVDVLDAVWVEDEERYYFHVTGNGCDGWIQAPFISPSYQEPIAMPAETPIPPTAAPT